MSVLEKFVYQARFMKPCLETGQCPGGADGSRTEEPRFPTFSSHAVIGEVQAKSHVTGSSGNGPSVDYYLLNGWIGMLVHGEGLCAGNRRLSAVFPRQRCENQAVD